MDGKISPDRFVTMSQEELKSAEQRRKENLLQEENMKKAQVPMAEKSISDALTCSKCKQKKVSYSQAQTRSADEPMTTFCECTVCGNRWKVGLIKLSSISGTRLTPSIVLLSQLNHVEAFFFFFPIDGVISLIPRPFNTGGFCIRHSDSVVWLVWSWGWDRVSVLSRLTILPWEQKAQACIFATSRGIRLQKYILERGSSIDP